MKALDEDLARAATGALARADPTLGALIARVGPYVLRPRRGVYYELIRSVVHQQLAGAAAGAIFGRLVRTGGGRLPPAPALAVASDGTLRGVGLSGRKIATIRAVAEAFADGGLSGRRLARMDDDAVIAALTKIKGIGEWTGHMLLMHALRRPDVLPVGDYGVRKGAASLYGLAQLPGRAELEALGEPWRPYRTVATWYLWRQSELAGRERETAGPRRDPQLAARKRR